MAFQETDATTKTVYALVDPRDMTVKYVGSSVDPEARVVNHMANLDKAENAKQQLVNGMRASDVRPMLVRFGEVPIDVAEHIEKQIIQAVAQAGHLTNTAWNRKPIQPSVPRDEMSKVRDLALSLLALTESEGAA